MPYQSEKDISDGNACWHPERKVALRWILSDGMVSLRMGNLLPYAPFFLSVLCLAMIASRTCLRMDAAVVLKFRSNQSLSSESRSLVWSLERSLISSCLRAFGFWGFLFLTEGLVSSRRPRRPSYSETWAISSALPVSTLEAFLFQADDGRWSIQDVY